MTDAWIRLQCVRCMLRGVASYSCQETEVELMVFTDLQQTPPPQDSLSHLSLNQNITWVLTE